MTALFPPKEPPPRTLPHSRTLHRKPPRRPSASAESRRGAWDGSVPRGPTEPRDVHGAEYRGALRRLVSPQTEALLGTRVTRQEQARLAGHGVRFGCRKPKEIVISAITDIGTRLCVEKERQSSVSVIGPNQVTRAHQYVQ